MYREVLINVDSQEKRVAILEDKRLEEFYVERVASDRLVGNIYKGIVESIVPAIGAAFINIGLPRNGFLYIQDLTQPDFEKMAELIDKPAIVEPIAGDKAKLQQKTDIKDAFKVGQEILVQIVKEPLGTKGARLTTHIGLPGRYMVLMPCDNHRGISRRIKDVKERSRLKDLVRNLKVQDDMGIIVRTAGGGSTKKQFLQDLRYLTNLWRKIKANFQKVKAPCRIHEEYDLVIRTLRDNFTAESNKLLVDSKEEYKRILRFLNIFSPSLRPRVQLCREDLPLFEKRGVEDEIVKLYERKIALKSGGQIMIEPTEALVAIDVNSGKFTRKKDPEETSYLVNLEAAREIARQVRLRDLGGIIIIDFIDMKQARHRKGIFDVLSEVLKRDHAKTDISTVSSLGLIEMTRQRVRKSIESVVYEHCPYCQGRGLVKSPATMAIVALRNIKKIVQKTNKKTFLVFVQPNVASQLLNQNRQHIIALERHFKVKILIRQEPSLHIEKLRIEPV